MVEQYLRLIAGFFVLLSLALSHYHSEYWLFFTAFVGVNLFQSGITNWCLMMDILKWVFKDKIKDENCRTKESC